MSQKGDNPELAVATLIVSASQSSPEGAVAAATLLQTLKQDRKAKNMKMLKLISCAAFLASANSAMTMPALSQQARDLNTTSAGIALSLTCYYFAHAIQSLIIGPVADRFGRRVPMLLAHAVFIVATLVWHTYVIVLPTEYYCRLHDYAVPPTGIINDCLHRDLHNCTTDGISSCL